MHLIHRVAKLGYEIHRHHMDHERTENIQFHMTIHGHLRCGEELKPNVPAK